MFVSVVVPAYKQEATIKDDLKRIYSTMRETRWHFEIILVVDGDVDNTFKRAKSLERKNLKVYCYRKNKGKGYAIRYGMAKSKGDFIAFIDSGMDINPNGLSIVLEHMEWYNADIIIASKRHPASKVNLTPVRRLYSFGYHALVKILFRLPVKDTQVGLKVFKREVLLKVFPRLVIKEFALDIEILAVARRLGFKRIFEAPVELELAISENSKWSGALLFMNKNVRIMFIDTLAVFYRMYFLRYYDDVSKRKWKFDKELRMRVNTGGMK